MACVNSKHTFLFANLSATQSVGCFFFLLFLHLLIKILLCYVFAEHLHFVHRDPCLSSAVGACSDTNGVQIHISMITIVNNFVPFSTVIVDVDIDVAVVVVVAHPSAHVSQSANTEILIVRRSTFWPILSLHRHALLASPGRRLAQRLR